jgi:hypothetical protein
MTEGKVLVSMSYQPADVFDTTGAATAAISATVGTGALVVGGGEARNRSVSTASQASAGAGEKAKDVVESNLIQFTAPASTPEKVRPTTVGAPGSTPSSTNSSASKGAAPPERQDSPVSTTASARANSGNSRFRTDSAAERPQLSEQTARSRSASTISQPGIAPSPSAASTTESWVSAEEPERTSDSNTDKASSEAAVLTQLATAGAVAGVAVPVPVTSFYRTLSEFTERTTSTIGTLRCCNLNLCILLRMP